MRKIKELKQRMEAQTKNWTMSDWMDYLDNLDFGIDELMSDIKHYVKLIKNQEMEAMSEWEVLDLEIWLNELWDCLIEFWLIKQQINKKETNLNND